MKRLPNMVPSKRLPLGPMGGLTRRVEELEQRSYPLQLHEGENESFLEGVLQLGMVGPLTPIHVSRAVLTATTRCVG